MIEPRSAPIGVFDSGVGGLTVVRALRQVMPTAPIIYLGDTARVPYGSKSPRTIERYSLACQRFLLDRQVGMVLIACNTASANALPALQAASPVPVIGAVEPGAEAALAATQTGVIGVIGTLSTVRSRAYERALASRPGVRTLALACPLLVPLAEEGWTDPADPIARAVAERYLGQLLGQPGADELDTLVLGCTHYPLLAPVLRAAAADLAGRPIAVVDSARAMANRALALRPGHADPTAPRGTLHCYATDTSRLDELAPRFLGEPVTGFELVDL